MPVTDDDQLRKILEQARTIAVVGASDSPQKDAHEIPGYLQEQGYRIVPVNPARDEVLGVASPGDLREIDGPVDVVDVFRPAEEASQIARAAVDIGAAVLWLQIGVRSDEAAAIAEDAGLTVVMDTCIGATHRRLGIGPVSE